MKDREMLELAAKAAGVFMTREQWPYSDPPSDDDFSTRSNEDGSITGRVVWYGSNGEVGGTDDLTWDPLNDDGDEARLEAVLGLNVEWQTQHVIVGRTMLDKWQESYALHDGDKQAARRFAGVRVAAGIGKSMEAKNA